MICGVREAGPARKVWGGGRQADGAEGFEPEARRLERSRPAGRRGIEERAENFPAMEALVVRAMDAGFSVHVEREGSTGGAAGMRALRGTMPVAKARAL